ncbi:MAG: hypothetical protein NTY19_46300, partial [Planctomycetota bacterium]|nr:hypothetical protein [Planctomycetota bacterium]
IGDQIRQGVVGLVELAALVARAVAVIAWFCRAHGSHRRSASLGRRREASKQPRSHAERL